MARTDIPSISVITPSFNQASYLEHTIRSVLRQRYPKLQYIVIDGQSTDGSVEIIKRYETDLDYWVSERDDGQSDAINKGLRVTEGQVVTWVNSDDVLMPGSLAAAARAWQRDPGLGLLSGDCIRIGPHNEFLFWRGVPRLSRWFAARGLMYIDQAGTFWRRDAVLGALELDVNLNCTMDYDLFYRIALAGARTRRLRRCLAAFRIHDRAKSSTMLKSFRDEDILLRRKYCPEVTKVSLFTRTTYRIWKSLNGDYVRSVTLTRFPPKGVLGYLQSLQGAC